MHPETHHVGSSGHKGPPSSQTAGNAGVDGVAQLPHSHARPVSHSRLAPQLAPASVAATTGGPAGHDDASTAVRTRSTKRMGLV